MNESIEKNRIGSWKNGNFSGDPESNANEWNFLRHGKKTAHISEILDSDLKYELYRYKEFIGNIYKFLGLFGIAASLFSTFISSDFKDFSVMTAASWEIAYCVLAIVFLILGLINLVGSYMNRKYSFSNVLKHLNGEE